MQKHMLTAEVLNCWMVEGIAKLEGSLGAKKMIGFVKVLKADIASEIHFHVKAQLQYILVTK